MLVTDGQAYPRYWHTPSALLYRQLTANAGLEFWYFGKEWHVSNKTVDSLRNRCKARPVALLGPIKPWAPDSSSGEVQVQYLDGCREQELVPC